MDLTFKDYQEESKKTIVYDKVVSSEKEILYYVTLGLVGETGEIAEKVKKIIRDEGGKLTKEKKDLLKKELGDVLWYLSQLCSEIGLSFEEVASHNLEKLSSRKKRNKLHGDGDNR